MDLPDAPNLTTSGGILGVLAGAAYVLVRFVQSNRVTNANDNAQINIIAVLQAERDAAVKRADEAVAQRDAAMAQLGDFKTQIAKLEMQVEHLSEQIASLTGAKPVVTNVTNIVSAPEPQQ